MTGDIVSVAINLDGWSANVTLAGNIGIGGTYSFGFGTNNDPATGAPKVTFTVVSLGYDNTGTATTLTRTVYGTHEIRVPYNASTIPGSFTSGTFADGETITQATSGATAIVVDNQSAGATLLAKSFTGTPNTSGIWTGGTSGATFTPTAAPVVVYNATTPYNNERYDGTNTILKIALSDYVYAKDTTGGGNSGTAPVVNILSGFYTKSGTPNNASGSGFAVTNNSAMGFAAALGQWDHIAGVSTADRVKSDFVAAMNARHRSGIACVKFDATGETSGATATVIATTQTATVRSATGLYESAYQVTMPISGFTQGELIDLRARVYPLVGDSTAVLDTNSHTTANEECLGYNKAIILCDKSNLLDVVKYVSTSGNDSTGDGSSTTPYATVAKAMKNGNIVYLKAGSYYAVGSSQTRKTTNEWVIVQPAPGEGSSTVTVQIVQASTGQITYRCQRMMYQGVKMQLVSGGSPALDGEDVGNFLRFKNCVFDRNSVTPTVGPGYRSTATYFENCTGDMGPQWQLAAFSTSRVAQSLDGVTLAGTGNMSAIYRMTCCSSTTALYIGETPTADPAPTPDNLIFESNLMLKAGGSANVALSWGDSRANSIGASISNNVIEHVVTAQKVMTIDGSGTTPLVNILMWNNTLVGEGSNLGYNDGGSTSILQKLWSIKNNIIFDAFKTDDFSGNGGADGHRVGNWSLVWGVSQSGNNLVDIIFPSEFNGLKTVSVAHSAVNFVSDKSGWATAAGGGDYHLTTGSSAIGLSRDLVFPYDIEGKARTSGDAAGAYTYQSALLRNFGIFY